MDFHIFPTPWLHWDKPAGELTTMSNTKNVLAEGIEITGTIKFQNDMIIDGKQKFDDVYENMMAS